MNEDIRIMKTYSKENVLINHSAILHIFNTKEYMLDFIEYVINLQTQLQQKENIIKEAREYIESYMPNYDFDKTNLIKLLEILDKENK